MAAEEDDRTPTGKRARVPRPSAAPVPPPGSPHRALLHLKDVGAPIVTWVRERGPDHLTVEQALPFLQLHAQVADERGRSGRIEGVELEFHGGIPHLVLRMRYGDAMKARPDGTLQGLGRSSPRAGGASSGKTGEGTVPFEAHQSILHEIAVGTPSRLPPPPSLGRLDSPVLLRSPVPPPQVGGFPPSLARMVERVITAFGQAMERFARRILGL